MLGPDPLNPIRPCGLRLHLESTVQRGFASSNSTGRSHSRYIRGSRPQRYSVARCCADRSEDYFDDLNAQVALPIDRGKTPVMPRLFH